MEMENRLEAVKLALIDLVDQLRPTDTIGIVAYTDDAFIVLNPTPVSEADRIKTAIRGLYTMGSTNVQDGLLLGYQMAYENFDPQRLNRIILCSDGVANTGDVLPEEILATVDQYARDDIMLTTVGFGMGNYNDVLMEQIADNGGGQYYYVDSYPEARRLFVDELTTTLVTIARDAKIQVQFNPATVAYYRLMGYENRDIADVDFRDDSVDGGEINTGHSITALYEIIPTDYNKQGPIALVTLRWIDPATGRAREMSRSIEVWERRQGLDDTSASFQLDIAAAAFADKLSNGAWAQNVTWDDLMGLMAWLSGGFPGDPDVPEFDALVRRAAQLGTH
jgi:Ca-activated chloride channel homolog